MFHYACSNQAERREDNVSKGLERDRKTANEWGFLCGAMKAAAEEPP